MYSWLSNRLNRKISKKGFTLPEVLITLGIIGIIAAITIPTLITNIQNQQYKTAYKKAFADASAAYKNALYDDKLVSVSSSYDIANNTINFNAFMSYFNVAKSCKSNNNSSCWEATGQSLILPEVWPLNTAYAFIDSSGRAWSEVCTVPASCSHGNFINILVDINGFKGPNQYGKDRFGFNTVIDGKESEAAHQFGAGFPSKIYPLSDRAAPFNITCPTGNCYYTSWLAN